MSFFGSVAPFVSNGALAVVVKLVSGRDKPANMGIKPGVGKFCIGNDCVTERSETNLFGSSRDELGLWRMQNGRW